MARPVASDDGDIGFQIAPMVDVVFVLMLFFMACAGSQMAERELRVKLPGEEGTCKTPIVVEITASGEVSINQKNYGAPNDRELSALCNWLTNTREQYGDDPLIVRPALDARHERIVDVLNAVAKAKVKNLTFG